ncbi:MAG: hypothetical protein ACJ73D_08095 [Pyrinomonadaceae bacterium]
MRSGAAISRWDRRYRRNIILALMSMCISLAIAPAIFAQDDDTDAAPPPIAIVPKNDKAELASEATLKDRAKISLTLMDGHIAAAEKLSNEHDPNGAFKELGMFEGLMDDSVTYLAKNDTNNGKTLDALRKLEIGLRAFMPRLETIRRILPMNCDDYVRKLMAHLRDARDRAIDPMFSDNVVKPRGTPHP